MNPHPLLDTTRRHFFGQCAVGVGAVALNQLLTADGHGAVKINPAQPMAQREPHFPAKAKRVIFIFSNGGVSHMDTFDHKPELFKADGKMTGVGGVGGSRLRRRLRRAGRPPR